MSTLETAKRQPTLASVWQAMADGTIGDELLEWPPDLFALTEVILQRSEAYRFALSPPAGSRWPPDHDPSWSAAVIEGGREWSTWVATEPGNFPTSWLANGRSFATRMTPRSSSSQRRVTGALCEPC